MKKEIYVRVVPELKEKLLNMATQTGLSLNALIVQACWRLLIEHEYQRSIRPKALQRR